MLVVSNIAELVRRSNLLGSDRTIANEGGGNASMKGLAVDHTERELSVVWVKASGADLASIKEPGFPALRLDDLLLLQERTEMSDEEMVEYIRRCALDSNAPRPSIETLLHAFLPATHIDHTHPDSVIALTAIPSGRELAPRVFGDEALWIPWKRPGFALATEIAVALAEQPAVRAVLLEKHGLITWGETSDEAYDSTLEFARRAEDALREVSAEEVLLGGEAVSPVSDEAADSLLAVTLPALRGALLADRGGVVLEVDRSDEARSFASSRRGPVVSQIGSPCPDHLINTKHKPLAIEVDPPRDDAEVLAAKLRGGGEGYGAWDRQDYEHKMTDEGPGVSIEP